MKTRNNDSTHDETLLNQSITRRSFVKRGAVASAATVFGGSWAHADSALAVPWIEGEIVTYTGPAKTVTFTPTNFPPSPSISAMEQALTWLGWDDQYQPPRTAGDWTVVNMAEKTYNPYTHKIVDLVGATGADGNPTITPGTGFPANAITSSGTSVTITLTPGMTYSVIKRKKVALTP